MRLLIHWLISAISLEIVAHFVDGFHVRGFIAALIAAAVIGLINATLGVVLKILTFPLTILTLGFFLIVVNAIMLRVASFLLSPEFSIDGWWAALIGAILLSLVSAVLHWIAGDERKRTRDI